MVPQVHAGVTFVKYAGHFRKKSYFQIIIALKIIEPSTALVAFRKVVFQLLLELSAVRFTQVAFDEFPFPKE